MSIENGVFNLSHSSGVLCVKQVATCVINSPGKKFDIRANLGYT